MIYLGNNKIGNIYSGDRKVDKIYKGEELVYTAKSGGIPSHYVLATDDDFSGTSDGGFRYTGSDDYVIIPNVIKGVTITSTDRMFREEESSKVKGVATLEGNIITNTSYMFWFYEALTLELSYMNTRNVTNMTGMFMYSNINLLNLSLFDTSNVTRMADMFYQSTTRTLDLASFNTSNVDNMADMFGDSQAIIGYARTQADADRLNASSGKPSSLKFVVKPQ